MLDLKFIRNNPDVVKKALEIRDANFNLETLLDLDDDRRRKIFTVEQLKQRRNEVSEEVARLKRAGQSAEALIQEMRAVAQQIKEIDTDTRIVEEKLQALVLQLPNIPDAEVPYGADDSENVEVSRWGEPRQFDFTPVAHWDIGERLGLIDFNRGAKVSGARFSFYTGSGARLERALINLMLDRHVDRHGYTEMFPPFLVKGESMVGTGQLPKFAADMYKVEGEDYYLIPTAEVPVTNFLRDEILAGEALPRKYAAYSACFRAEAGSAGRDTRGLIRQHQFNKVELVKFCHPENSDTELATLMEDAADILKLLQLPYRVVILCSGDLGFSAAKTYDLEVWMPAQQTYREISSCSNFTDFQARRANIRYRKEPGGKADFVHTLNGSGLAIGRTLAAILENYQRADGTLEIPAALQPYMGGKTEIVL